MGRSVQKRWQPDGYMSAPAGRHAFNLDNEGLGGPVQRMKRWTEVRCMGFEAGTGYVFMLQVLGCGAFRSE
jgi:hypothetical protein